MKDLKNPELQKELLFYCLIALMFGALGLLVSPVAGLLGLGAGLAGGGLHLWCQHRRYREIAALSRSIDRILHGQDQLLDDSTEGELAILRSEIRKMTVQLRESADLLQKDKQELSQARKQAARLKSTEEKIAALEQEDGGIDSLLADEAVFSDSDRVFELTTRKAAISAELEELYALWEELAETVGEGS